MKWLRKSAKYARSQARNCIEESQSHYKGFDKGVVTCLRWIDECKSLSVLRTRLIHRYVKLLDEQFLIDCNTEEYAYLEGLIVAYAEAIKVIQRKGSTP